MNLIKGMSNAKKETGPLLKKESPMNKPVNTKKRH